MPEILQGFFDLKDSFNYRIEGELKEAVNTAVQQALAVHNQLTEQMFNLFVAKTTEHKIRYESPVAARLQPLDEHGRARKIHGAGFYDVAFPLKKAGTSFGWTREARIKMTVKQANDFVALALDADKRWNRDHILSALFTNTGYSWNDPKYGALNIVHLANGDSTVYLTRPGFEDGETANHYRTVAAIDNNGPFAAIHTDLTKRPENGGDGKVICFINSAQRATVKGLADFIEAEDSDIRLGANERVLVGGLGVSVPGEVIGKVERCWISVWDGVPANYILALITSGDRPIVMREHPEAELQGFQAVADREDHPYLERHFERHAGFAGWNRVGAMVYQVTGGAYTIPTGLNATTMV